MGIFNRKKGKNLDSTSADNKEVKGSRKRPANTAFKQQKLRAWQPILTPKIVLPTLFIIGIIFAPIGVLLIWGASLVSEISFDYTDCESLTPSTANASLSFTPIPSNKFSYRLRATDSGSPLLNPPLYAFLDNTNNASVTDVSAKKQCVVQFDIPADLEPSVLFYYKLTNFYQNHRRYIQSFNSDQLMGKFVSPSSLDSSDCSPLGTIGGTAIYPCGYIANSLFNDTFSNPILLNSSGESSHPYTFSSIGIAWSGEARKYAASPIGQGGYPNLSSIVPPPAWKLRFPNNYTEQNPPPDLSTDEHFQNWMRLAGLPTFTKLYGRNDADTMRKGTYMITIGLNYPVIPYKGTKSFVISTVSWMGGKNSFLGWAYVAASGVFLLLAVLSTARQILKPRRLDKRSFLSWARE